MADKFWFLSTAFVDDDVADRALEWYEAERFEQHFNRAGCSAAWLLGTIRHKDTWGTPFPNLVAMYQVDDPVTFASGLFDTQTEWGRFADSVYESLRLTRRLLCEYESRPQLGDVWANVRINFLDLPQKDRLQEVEFNEWYNAKHVPDICAFPGFYRAWRLSRTGQRLPAKYDEDYWAFYEIDEPATLMKPVLNPWWDGVWQNNISPGSLARSYHVVKARLEKSDAN